jgi:hypothetical protein
MLRRKGAQPIASIGPGVAGGGEQFFSVQDFQRGQDRRSMDDYDCLILAAASKYAEPRSRATSRVPR